MLKIITNYNMEYTRAIVAFQEIHIRFASVRIKTSMTGSLAKTEQRSACNIGAADSSKIFQVFIASIKFNNGK